MQMMMIKFKKSTRSKFTLRMRHRNECSVEKSSHDTRQGWFGCLEFVCATAAQTINSFAQFLPQS